MTEHKCNLNPAISYPESIPQAIAFWAEKAGNAIAILAPGRMPLTYRRLYEQIEYIVAALNRMGVGRNDRVALIAPDGPELAVAYLGIASGAIVATLDTAFTASEYDSAFADRDIRALVIQGILDSPAREVAQARSIPIIELIPSWEWEAGMFALVGKARAPASCTGIAEPDDICCLYNTSGTTSRSKVVASTHKRLCIRARYWQLALQLGETDRILNVMPLIYSNGSSNGLFSTLFSGGSVVCTPGHLLSGFFEWLDCFQPTYFTGTPTIHRAILDQVEAHRDIIARASLRFIGASSAAMPRDMQEKLETSFNVPVIQWYAATECSPLAVNPLPPGNRKLGSVGVLAGTELSIIDEAGSFLPAGSIGEIVVRGPTVLPSYENNPEANEESFVDGWFRMGDLGYFDSEGYLFLTGRVKEIINRGGEKISPHEVNDALMDHPAIAEAETFAIPHPRLGEEVAAVIVLRKGATATEQEFQEHLSRRLARFKVPRRILIVEEIPKGPTGKVQRHKLAERFEKAMRLPPKNSAGYTPPRTPVEEQLARIWREVLGVERVGIQDDFLNLGGDSIQAALVANRACAFFKIQLPLSELFKSSTIVQMAEVVTQAKLSGSPKASLIQIRGGGSMPPLFWLHGSQGVIFWYQNLADYLNPDQPIYGIVPLELDLRKSYRLRVEDMATRYISEIRKLQPEGPYFLAGPSAAGLWAFEMARQLDVQGQKVGLVALIDTHCPSRPGNGFLSLPKTFWECGHKAAQLGPRQGISYLLDKTKDSRLGFVFDYFQADIGALSLMRILGKSRCKGPGFSRPTGPKAAQKEIAAACRRALKHYWPRPYPGRLVFFWAEQRESFVPPESDVRAGWHEIALGGLQIHRIPCAHTEILAHAHIQTVAGQINAYVEEALR